MYLENGRDLFRGIMILIAVALAYWVNLTIGLLLAVFVGVMTLQSVFTDWCAVEAELCDHKIPSLIYRITEEHLFQIAQRIVNKVGRRIDQSGTSPDVVVEQTGKPPRLGDREPAALRPGATDDVAQPPGIRRREARRGQTLIFAIG